MACSLLVRVKYFCSSLVKPYYTKITIHPLFTIYDHFTRSPPYWISSKRNDPYIKTFSALYGVKTVFLILPQLDIFLYKCSETMLKTTIHRTYVTFFPCSGVLGSKFGPQSGQLLALESFAIKIVSSRLRIC